MRYLSEVKLASKPRPAGWLRARRAVLCCRSFIEMSRAVSHMVI